jgi:hypothetical protein
MSFGKSMLLTLGTLSAAACNRDSGDARRDTAAAPAADTSMAGMSGMRGGTGAGSAQTLVAMGNHLRSIENASGAELERMLSVHRPTVANMIAQVDREMRDMNMPGDAAWNAALDSLRQDLRVMPELSPQALKAMMPAHVARVRRVIDMHRSMMARMGH